MANDLHTPVDLLQKQNNIVESGLQDEKPAQFEVEMVLLQQGSASPSLMPPCPLHLPQPFKVVFHTYTTADITCFPSSGGSLANTDCVASPRP